MSLIIVNILANNTFKYPIIETDKRISPTLFNFDIFSLSTNSQYNDTKFKRLVINSEVLIQSIREIGQLKALKQIDISFEFDKNIAGLDNLIFGIENAVFI